ncbi:interferon-induced protein with tetratricopeptide repeats 1-like [Labeo rohita]|uniref:interferon-induced protein with tetratricopeptide repeats 1-like n=1 Tax=Labeo rohita TaxID=84645 RepID=UPI0021E21F5D|nr:interferon-induced protein with tetratricopeptide repeats 1-like [Labeo rohita]
MSLIIINTAGSLSDSRTEQVRTSRGNISQTGQLTIIMDLRQHLQKLECHFTWDLGQYPNELKALRRTIQDILEQECTWLVHHYNLLGYIEQALGSNSEALKYLRDAESVMQEHGTDETGVRLQVNKANLAWVYFHMGEMDKSKGYLEEVESLQRMHPAPPGCALHPEVSGEKGWTLVKFNMPKKCQAINNFKMALKAEPENKEWHKCLAIAMNEAYPSHNCPPEHKDEILKQVKTAHEKEPNDLLFNALYLEKLSEVQSANTESEMQGLLEKTLETGNLECLGTILRYYRTISEDTAIQAAERAREKFPTSNRVLKFLASCYKWKVYKLSEDSRETRTLARKSIKLFEEVLRHYPDSLRDRVALASLHYYAHNSKRTDEIYQQILSEKDDLPPHSQQYIYYCYASHLYKRRQLKDSINFHMKAAAILEESDDRQKSISILHNIGKNDKNPRCVEIQNFLKEIKIYV